MIVDDIQTLEVSKLKVCALRVSSQVWNWTVKEEGKILSLDCLTPEFPKGCGTMFQSGLQNCQDVYWHFGKLPETPQNHTKP